MDHLYGCDELDNSRCKNSKKKHFEMRADEALVYI